MANPRFNGNSNLQFDLSPNVIRLVIHRRFFQILTVPPCKKPISGWPFSCEHAANQPPPPEIVIVGSPLVYLVKTPATSPKDIHCPISPFQGPLSPMSSRIKQVSAFPLFTHHLCQSQTQGLQDYPGLQQGRERSHGPSHLGSPNPLFSLSSSLFLTPLRASTELVGQSRLRGRRGGKGGRWWWWWGALVCTAPQEFHTGGRRVPGVVWEGGSRWGMMRGAKRQREVWSCPTDYSQYNMLIIWFIKLH